LPAIEAALGVLAWCSNVYTLRDTGRNVNIRHALAASAALPKLTARGPCGVRKKQSVVEEFFLC